MASSIRVHSHRRRPPTLTERLIGRTRARRMQRRVGVTAVGVGMALLMPTLRQVTITVLATGAVLVAALAVLS